jgi:hypothetical protein
MARTRRLAPEPSDLDLTVGFHTRISEEAKELLRKLARESGIKPATCGRQLLYRGLGIIKGGNGS